jgi:hypothetical protein
VSEKHFPPPGNEIGYREAASPLAPAAPEMPVVHRHVVASRPEDPEIAERNAELEGRIARQDRALAVNEARRRRAARIAGTMWLVIVVACLAAAAFSTHHRHLRAAKRAAAGLSR